MTFEYEKQRLEYGQIILTHIDKILKLSLLNFCDGINAGRYKSAVVSLGDSLYAYFDDEMLTAQERFDVESLRDVNSIRAYRIYFRELLMLVKRVDYFKNAVYGEADNEIIEDEGVEE